MSKLGHRLQIYELLLAINAGFDSVERGLITLSKTGAFDGSELLNLGALSAEARAAIASYVTGVIETMETNEAGRLYRRRLIRERKQEHADST